MAEKGSFLQWMLHLLLPGAGQHPLSIRIYYCRCKNSVGFHYFIGMRSTDSDLLSVLTPFPPPLRFTENPQMEETTYTVQVNIK